MKKYDLYILVDEEVIETIKEMLKRKGIKVYVDYFKHTTGVIQWWMATEGHKLTEKDIEEIVKTLKEKGLYVYEEGEEWDLAGELYTKKLVVRT